MLNFNAIISYERKLYFNNTKEELIGFIVQSHRWKIWQFIKTLRLEEKYIFFSSKCFIYKIILIYVKRKKNKLGRLLGFDIPAGVFSPGLLIWHISPIVVNPHARVGQNAVIVGNLCIGNNNGSSDAPQIGDGVIFGWGSSIVGKVKIGNYCKIGANSFVNKSFSDNQIIVGSPAKNIGQRR